MNHLSTGNTTNVLAMYASTHAQQLCAAQRCVDKASAQLDAVCTQAPLRWQHVQRLYLHLSEAVYLCRGVGGGTCCVQISFCRLEACAARRIVPLRV